LKSKYTATDSEQEKLAKAFRVGFEIAMNLNRSCITGSHLIVKVDGVVESKAMSSLFKSLVMIPPLEVSCMSDTKGIARLSIYSTAPEVSGRLVAVKTESGWGVITVPETSFKSEQDGVLEGLRKALSGYYGLDRFLKDVLDVRAISGKNLLQCGENLEDHKKLRASLVDVAGVFLDTYSDALGLINLICDWLFYGKLGFIKMHEKRGEKWVNSVEFNRAKEFSNLLANYISENQSISAEDSDVMIRFLERFMR